MNRSEYVKQYIKENNYSYMQVAEETCTSQSAISKYFTDSTHRRQPSDHLIRVIQLLKFARENGLNPPPPII